MPVSHAQAPQTVLSTWSLIPDGITSGGSFRLLFVTGGKSNATSTEIGDYNDFVQNQANLANDSGAPIRDFKAEFRAVISTTAVHARDNIAATGTGVPIYWLNGDKIADNYAGFYDGTWDSTVGRNQHGTIITARDVWTGSNNDGTKNIEGGATSRAAGAFAVRIGMYEVAGKVLRSSSSGSNNALHSLYALSPLITVSSSPAFDTSTIPAPDPAYSYPADRTIQTLTLPPAIGGTGALSYTLMPDASSLGLSFDPVNRTLSGMPITPTVATALTYTVSDGATPTPNTAALTFSVTITAALPPPISQTVSANYTFAPTGTNGVSAGGSFRLLFVTTQTTAATSDDINTYNTFVQASATSAGGGHSAIQPFSDEFRALISTEAVAARDNTATNRDTGTDTNAPIYWLGSGDQVATGYGDFYDGGWSFSTAGRDQNGGTYTFSGSPYIWTGSERDGTVGIDAFVSTAKAGAGSIFGGVKSTKVGNLVPNEELVASVATSQLSADNIFPLYALSPILILNHAPTISTVIPDQTAPVGIDFTYTFPAFTDADNDTITYSASEDPNAAWLNFDSDSLFFSGRPTAADVGSITITVTAFDGIDEVSTEFSVAAIPPPPEPQTVSVALKPSEDFAAGDKFRLLFVTTQTTAATSADINTYNTFVQDSAAGSSDPVIRDFSDQFRALISTATVDARDNTATNRVSGTDTNASIYWLGSNDQVAADYGDFYNGDWGSVAGRDRNGVTYTHPNENPESRLIWTGSKNDGTVGRDTGDQSDGITKIGAGSIIETTVVGRLARTNEFQNQTPLAVDSNVLLPLYALSPILILNQVPTLTTAIPDQTAPIGGAFTYTFSDTTFTDADSDTITYSASEDPDAAWLNFDSDSRTFSGTPTAANAGFITITVTASDGMDSVTDEFTVKVATTSLAPVPTSQTVPASFALKPGAVPAGGSFRLLFVTTQTTDATSGDIATYNTFVQTSAAVGDSDIQGFNSEFRALISTTTVEARDNTATNTATGTDTEAPIYWLGMDGKKVADDYNDFYNGNWDFVAGAGKDQNGDTTTPSNIWTGSENDGTEGMIDGISGAVGKKGIRVGSLSEGKEITDDLGGFNGLGGSFELPLYALSPILTLNHAPAVSTPIRDQTAFAGAAFTYTFTAFTDADNDTITYSASESLDATWLNFDAATRTFSGRPAVANDGEVIAITVTASDDMDSVSDVFTVTVRDDTTVPVFTSGAGAASVAVTIKVGLSTSLAAFVAVATDDGGAAHAGIIYSLSGADVDLFTIDDSGRVTYIDVPKITGTQTLIVTATDAAGNFAEQQLNIELTGAPILTITPGNINILGEYARDTFQATFTWSEAVSGFEEVDIFVSRPSNPLLMVTDGLKYTKVISLPDDNNDGFIIISVDEGSAKSATNVTNADVQVIQKYDAQTPEFTVGATDTAIFVLNDPSSEVYDAAATDGGGTADDGITYSLAEVNNYARFNIDPGSGVVTYNAPPTDGDSHSIRIVATDKGGNMDTLNLSISVINRPTVVSVSATDGFYKEDGSVPITVTFSEAVTVTGTPRLVVDSSTTRSGGLANYASGSGLTLTFTYIVRRGDDTRDLDYAGTDALRLNGGTIQNAAAVDAYLILPTVGSPKSLFGTSDVVLDTTAPVFPDTSGLSSRHPVTIATGSTTTTVVYNANASDAGRAADMGITYELTFDSDGLFELDTSGVLTLLADSPGLGTYDATITATDEAGNVATLYLRVTVTGMLFVTIEDTITGTANLAHGALTFTLNFSEDVTGFVSSDLTVTGGTHTLMPNPGAAVTYTPSDIFTVVATPISNTNNGVLTITLAAAAATAIAGGGGRTTMVTTHTQEYDTKAPPTPIFDAIATDETINSAEQAGGVDITGTGESDTSVVLCFAGTDSVAACSDGLMVTVTVSTGTTTWSHTLSSDNIDTLSEGLKTFRAVATDEAGNSSTVASTIFTVDTNTPTPPTFDAIATDETINEAEQAGGVDITGTSESDTSVVLCFAGAGADADADADSVAACSGGLMVTVTVSAGTTTWSHTLSSDNIDTLSEGRKTFRAVATDEAGNSSTVASTNFTVDTIAPPAPTFDAIATDETINAVEQMAGVDITGAGESGASVALCFNDGTGSVAACSGGLMDTVTVSAGTGTWSYSLTSDNIDTLSEGGKTFRAVATDVAGNSSTVASTIFTVDTIAPAAPVFDTIATDDLINLAERNAVAGVTLTGTVGESGTTIQFCYRGDGGTTCSGGLVPSTSIINNVPGTTWSYPLTDTDYNSADQGDTNVQARATDTSGNTGDYSASKTFTVDTIAPVFSSGTTGAVAINSAITVTAYDANATNNGGASETADAGVTYTLGGSDADEFTFNADSGIVTYTSVQSDPDTHDIVITATDTAGNTATRNVRIGVRDAPEVIINSSVTRDYINGVITYTFSFSEAVTGFEASDVSVSMDDGSGVFSTPPNAAATYTRADTFTYAVTPTADTNDGVLTVTVHANAVMGTVTMVNNRLITVPQQYDTVVPILAGGDSSARVRYIFNDLPLASEAYNADATDAGGTAGITYSFGGGTEDALFNIDPGTGIVSYITLPTATGLTHNIRVVATDKGGNADTLPVTINVISSATVDSVSATDGFYKEGDSVPITITFSEAVTVTGTGTPQLALATNTNTGVTGVATYTAGSGAKALIFTYTVRAGDDTRNLAYTGTDALSLEEGVAIQTDIQTDSGLDTILTLPAVGSANSLSGASAGISAIVLDTAMPEFPGAATTPTTPLVSTIAIGSTTATMVYDANATDAGRAADSGISYTLGGGTDAMTFAIDADSGILTPVADITGVATYSVTITATDEPGHVSDEFYLRVIVIDLPMVTISDNIAADTPATRLTDTANSADGALTFTFGWSEAVTGFTAEDISVTGGSKGDFNTVTANLTYTLTVTPEPGTAGRLTIEVAAAVVTAVATDMAGNARVNSVSLPYTQAYDTKAPAAPGIDAVTGDDIIDAAERDAAAGVEVTGMKEPGASVILCSNPTTTDATCPGGTTYTATRTTTTWSVTLSTAAIQAFTTNIVTLTAIATNAAGNTAVSPGRDISVAVSAGATMETEITLPEGVAGDRVVGYVRLPVDGNLQAGIFEPLDTATDNPPAGSEFILTVDIALDIVLSEDATATVCLPTTGVPSSREAVLYHYDASDSPPWTDISSGSTSTREGGFVCGEIMTFSPFAVGHDTAPPAVTFTSTLAPHLTYTVGQEVALTLPRATALDVDGMLTYTYTLMPTTAESLPDGLIFVPETRTLAGTPTTETAEAETLIYTATEDDTEGMASLTFTVTIVSEVDTTATTRLNEQILSRAVSAMTAGTLAAVAARVDAAADGSGGSGKPVAFELDGRSSLRRLLEKNGKAMLEDTMDYERLLDGASFVLPLSATDGASTGNIGKTAVWGSSGFHNLADDADGLDWEGKTLSAHLGIDKRLSEQALAGLALSWNDAGFDYRDTADGEKSEGEYQYSVVTIHPYLGWSNDGLKLWGTVGFGQGEITIDQEGGEQLSTDTTQRSFAGGFNHRLTGSPGRSLHIKGDVALTRVAVEADQAGKFAEQDVESSRVRLLLSGERRRELASGGALTPSLEFGVRSDGGDGATGTGVEVGGGVRYANPGGKVAVAGNVRTLLAAGEYEELGADFSVRLSSKSGRGLSLTLHPVWGRTQSVADRLWNDGASDITAGDIAGGDTALRGSVDTEVGYGLSATMLGSPGILTPYTGITAQDGGSSRLRLGGRFAGGNGLSLNLEGTQKNTTDSASHQVLLRGEVAF